MNVMTVDSGPRVTTKARPRLVAVGLVLGAGGLGVAVAYLCAGLAACLLTGGRGSVWTTVGA